jgi:hypothetical protein
MSFYDEVDSQGIVEDHIKAALQLQADESDKVLSSYGQVRDRLVSRIATLPPGSFTAQHLRGVLAQVQGAIEAITSQLQGNMIDSAFDSALSGVDDLLSEIKTFENKFTGAVTPINLNSALLAQDTSNLLVTKYKTNLDAYGNDLYTQITNGLFSASIGETSHEEVVGRIAQFFTAEEWKLRRIVRTELHNIYNLGKMRGMGELADNQIPDLKKTLMHPMDSRTGDDSKYASQLGLVANIDEPFEYIWKGQTRSFMAPPDRPNDRSILVPYRAEWGSLGNDAEIPGRFPVME